MSNKSQWDKSQQPIKSGDYQLAVDMLDNSELNMTYVAEDMEDRV